MEDNKAEDVIHQAKKTAQQVNTAAEHRHDDPAHARPVSEGAEHTPTKGAIHEFSQLQSKIIELINSGYIESVQQLRDTLLDKEWDHNNRGRAMRQGVAAFERYVAEKDLVQQVGGYQTLSRLYDRPDSLEQVLQDDKLRMLARSMMEDAMSQRHMELYKACRDNAKEMASMTNQQVPGGVVGHGILGAAAGLWGVLRSKIPVLKLIK